MSLNTADAAANFGYQQYTYGMQDDWRVSDALSLTYGFRYDLYDMSSKVPYNPNAAARLGFVNTKTYKGLGSFQPRIGFNYKPTDTRLQPTRRCGDLRRRIA